MTVKTVGPRGRMTALASLAAATLALTACSSSGVADGSPSDPTSGSSTSSSTESQAGAQGSKTADAAGDAELASVVDGASQVTISLHDNVCELDFSSAKAGPVTFTVTNVSAPGITEVELRHDQRILGEKENLAPGLPTVNFTKTLDGGSYEIYCPGADTEKQKFVVTGTAPTSTNDSVTALLAEGAQNYGDYVTGVLTDMVTGVENLKTAVDSGDVAAARVKYALARPFYEKVESDIEGFVLPGFSPDDLHGSLDYLIDMRASSLDPDAGWHGFHAIERDLFTDGGTITDSTKQMAAELLDNVHKLVDVASTLAFAPEDLANGASALLEEVQNGKVSGEEEAYSHLDLLDMAANVEGAEQAFANLKPGLEKIDPELTKTVAEQFTVVRTALDQYRDSSQPGGFVLWTPELRKSDAAQLSKTIQALQDPMSRIAQKVATA